MVTANIGNDPETGEPVTVEITQFWDAEDGDRHLGFQITYGEDLVLALDGAWISRDANSMAITPENTFWQNAEEAVTAAAATLH